MKRTIILLQILFIASCAKEEPCAGERVRCTHTVYHGYLACPDDAEPGKWIYSNCTFYTDTLKMKACDTNAWLLKTRSFDESRKYEPNNNTWNEFARLYPNRCGCK